MLELILGFLSFAAVTAGVRIYLAYFVPRGARHAAFERWCEGRPLVFAMFVPRAGTSQVRRKSEATLGRHPIFVNLAGSYPWTHYGLRLEVEALGECVVAAAIASVRVLRGVEAPPQVEPIVRELARGMRGEATEIWLHADAFAPRGEAVEEGMMGWCGRIDEHGELALSPCRELPFWLRALPPRGPRDGRQRTDEARAASLVEGVESAAA